MYTVNSHTCRIYIMHTHGKPTWIWITLETPIMDIYEKFLSYPPTAQSKPVELRKIIMQVANNNPGIGVLTEGLRWGGAQLPNFGI